MSDNAPTPQDDADLVSTPKSLDQGCSTLICIPLDSFEEAGKTTTKCRRFFFFFFYPTVSWI